MPGKGKKSRRRRKGSGGSRPGRPRRVNQGMLNRMVALRKEGYTSVQIGAAVGLSDRRVKHYLGGVTPQLERSLGIERGKLLKLYAAWLENLILGELGWSIISLNKYHIALRAALKQMDDLTVGRLCESVRARVKFYAEFVKASPIGKQIEQYKQRILNARDPVVQHFALLSDRSAYPMGREAEKTMALAKREPVDLAKLLLDSMKD